MNNPTDTKFESWAIVELFGHQRIAGRVSEQAIGGCNFLRVDVPEAGGVAAFTKFYTQGAIYCLTPCDEATARQAVEHFRAQPINEFVLPSRPALPASPSRADANEVEYGYPCHEDEDDQVHPIRLERDDDDSEL